MTSLRDQLITHSFPGTLERVVAVSCALVENDITDVSNLSGIAHRLPMVKNIQKFRVDEVKWLVSLALRITKEAQTSKGIKRAASYSIDAPMLASSLESLSSDTQALGIAVCGPAKAARLLPIPVNGTHSWLQQARITALAGSCPRSHNEIRSAVRAYAAFACKVGRPALPPDIDLLLSWSCLFRCSGTFKNYVSGLRPACQIAGIPTNEMWDSMLAKAARAIDKRRGYIAREPMFLGFNLVKKLVASIGENPTPRVLGVAMAFLMTYTFLLRMPSECLPIAVGNGGPAEADLHAVVVVTADRLTLHLKRRKNRESPSTMQRSCWCSSCRLTCPVHRLGKYFLDCGMGASPFHFLDARSSLSILRGWLRHLDIQAPLQYRTHDFRRGHARDMARTGARLHEILKAGDWKSAAFLSYQDRIELERGAVSESHEADVAAHVNESSDDEN